MKRQKQKRSKASSKMANVVHSGWMTKSPPERKVNAPFKFFRAQWKKRFFVLRKPSGSLPDQYELHYYKDEHCASKKGSIDLEQCEQIIESLDSEHFPYLLAIKTVYRNKVRTYYLAVESETEMTSWVQCLCHVCGLKQEDSPTDIPEPKPAISQNSSKPEPHVIVSGHSSNGHAGNVPLSITTTPAVSLSTKVIHSQPSSIDTKTKNESAFSSPTYIPLGECVTGRPIRVDRSESTESMPDFNAPTAPPAYEDTPHEDDVFISGLYHRPPKPCKVPVDDDTYKVPPSRNYKPTNTGGAADETDADNKNSLYQVPPPRSKHETRRKSERTDSASSSNAPSENYDYPPSYKDADAGSIPPERPPRLVHTQSPYQNLIVKQTTTTDGAGADLSTVVAPPKPHSVGNANQGYDVPRSPHYISPPPPVPHRPNQHRGYVHPRATNQTPSSDGKGEEADGKEELDSSNLLSTTPVVPPRSGSGSDSQEGRSGSPSAVYHHPPPSSASSSSSSASVPPARPPARLAQRSQQPSRNLDGQEKEDAAVIFSTSRTRSFKRQHHIVKPGSNRANTLPMSVPVPAPRPVPGDYSSSDDADDEATHHSLSLLHSVPPPYDPDRELKYIDLDHPDTAAPEVPRSSTSHSHPHNSHSHHPHSHADRSKDSAIEYREIDFVKTKALKDTTKQVKEKERKMDDHN